MEARAIYPKQRDTVHSFKYFFINAAIVCVTIGLVLLLTAPTTPEIERRYDDETDGDGNLI